jgi:hypothetical protein
VEENGARKEQLLHHSPSENICGNRKYAVANFAEERKEKAKFVVIDPLNGRKAS